MDLETAQTTTTAKFPILKQGPVTTEEKVQKKNDVKARSMGKPCLVRIYLKSQKTVKIRQARTRESEEYKKKPKNQSRSQKSQTRTMEKAQRSVGFALNTLTELAQHVTSKNDMLAILRSPQINPTAQDQYLIIEGIEWRRLKDWRARQEG
ncbi:hypothetical protein Tco_0474048 [Tanacetum coccineum]